MIVKYENGIIGDVPEAGHDMGGYFEALRDCRFDRALESVWGQVRGLNQFIDTQKPWEIAKTGDAEHLRDVLAELVSDILQIADMLEPFMPTTAVKIRGVFETGLVRPLETTLFPRLEETKKAE